MKKGIKTLLDIIKDPERDVQDRVFIVLTILADLALILAIIGDLLVQEYWLEIAVLVVAAILGPIVSNIFVYKNKVNTGAAIIAMSIVFFILPVNFFSGGGLAGGSVIWYSFCFLYIGLILTGPMKVIMMACLTGGIALELTISYLHPEYVINHSREKWYVDATISILLVGIVIYIMVWFQNEIFKEESRRAKEQAKEIVELNLAQSRFFSSMSHEIRTPINTIIGLNEMTLRSEINDDVAENAKNIDSASKILLSVVNDILDMSKLESGKMEIIVSPCNVLNMLSDVVSMTEQRARDYGLDYLVEIDPRLPSALYFDEMRIKQVLINLINNAIKYTKEGSVSLSVSCQEIDKGRATVDFAVEDTGIGIHKDSIPYLFDAFRREDVEKNRYIEGTGLGLSIVRYLVDLMGGEISVNSVYTKGSTFVVTICFNIADETPVGKTDLHILRSEGKRKTYRRSFEAPEAKILIVDDNSSNLLVAEKLLRDTRVKIDTAESGAKCLELTAKKHYHAILMDHLMPEMDGIECLRALRDQAGGLNKETPVIALTANAGGESAALYRREGFDAYLVKPVDPGLLEESILSVLPKDLVLLDEESGDNEDIESRVQKARHKLPLLITTDSVSDLPTEVLEDRRIPCVPYSVVTDSGIFLDGTEVDGDVVFRYLRDSHRTARSEAPAVSDYETFFAEQLSEVNNILHITMAKNPSLGYKNSLAAAQAFYNVNIYESGHLSSGTGLLVLAAKDMVDAGEQDPARIMEFLDKKRNKIRTSFIVGNTEFLFRSGKITERIHKLCQALMLHPMITMKNSSMTVGGVILGSSERARSVYIRRALRHTSTIDRSVLFITYAGIRREEIEEIKEEAQSIVRFDKVYLQKASPAVSTNCGPGTIGLIFSLK